MSTAALLKAHTASYHDKLEMQMYVKEIFDRTLTFAQYCNLIHVNYVITDAIERSIHDALPANLRQELTIDKREKMQALEKDRKALGLHTIVMHHSHKPLYRNVQEAFGGMYVLEGATLGGNVIARHLKEMPVLQQQPFYFYSVYGNTTRDKWLAFTQVLNREVSEETSKGCVDKAIETFKFFHQVAQSMACTY